VIDIKNDLALFVKHCLSGASQYVDMGDRSAMIVSVEYSNIGIFINIEGAKLLRPFDNDIRAVFANAVIDDCEATIMLHYADLEFHQLEMYFDAGRNLEHWNRRIDEMRNFSGF
jgi:hypothetical protein